MNREQEQVALFWATLLQPILFRSPEDEGLSDGIILQRIAASSVRFPDGGIRRPSLSTLKRRLACMRAAGFKGLIRRGRNDRGTLRKVDSLALDRAEALKRDDPFRSWLMINVCLEAEGFQPIPRSTLLYHLRQRGATRAKLGVVSKKVRRRWTRDTTHDLWVGDFEHGPYVLADGQVVRSYQSAFIDAHSRFIVCGLYALNMDLEALIGTLLRAWSLHGKSRGLYVDNARVYHSPRLKAACFDLGIELLHRPVREPETGGIIERFFRTCQDQFEREVRNREQILTLEELNEAYEAWLEVVYHNRPHSETDMTPRQRYDLGLERGLQIVSPEVRTYFAERLERTVHRDFADVSIRKVRYRVPANLRGDRVEVRLDPYADEETVEIYSRDGRRWLAQGKRHDRDTPESPPEPFAKSREDILDKIIEAHHSRKQDDAPSAPLPARNWDFTRFLQTLEELTGFSPSQIGERSMAELLKIHERHPGLNRQAMRDAWKRASRQDLPGLIHELELL